MIAGKVLSGKKEAVSEEKQQEEMIQEESEDSTRPDNEETPDQTEVSDETESETEAEETDETALPFASGYTPEATSSTVDVNGEVLSNYALLVDLDENVIVAQRNARERISPASMTKILTVLVAAEHITDLDDTFTITTEITDYSYRNDCSAAGFVDGETVTVKDLLYGTILPSGADAAAGLAYYVAGSLDGFVELMNEKIEELGLSDTAHFTNCVGLYDENHYCTVYDMAMMLKAAVENDLCREVLSAHTYTTSSTEQHPDGLELSNWFLRRIEDKDTKGEVVCAKTGFVAQSGSCAASYEITKSGKHYICVTADTYSSWRCIYDHVAMYQQYTD
jgi:D-alanyl-D-alanine carboxypeptidase (penicillin-binding protein 5/6)